MKITVITAAYNAESTIVDCMESILLQGYANIEHILVDGGSNDRTVDIVREMSPDTRVVSESDEGLYHALNNGIMLATGEVIGFLHADDRFVNAGVIEKIAEIMGDDEVDGLYGDLTYVRVSGRQLRYLKAGNFNRILVGHGWMPPHPTLFLRSHVYGRYGRFDTSYRIAADYDFMLRILKEDVLKIHYLPHTLVEMRAGGMSNKGIANIWRKSMEDMRAVKRNGAGVPVLVVMMKILRKSGQFFRKHGVV
jgi:glycosyltransferase involved in cell wall biosynthesis